MKFVCSDLHFFHNNILKFTNRQFQLVEDMHESIIEEWNSVVGKGDLVYHLGDLSFLRGDQHKLYQIIDRLNGMKHFLKGNHDHEWKKHRQAGLRACTFDDSPYTEVKHNKKKIVMCHYPILSWNGVHHGSLHCHGHTHGTLDFNLGRAMDVGYDALKNKGLTCPVSLDTVVDMLSKKEQVYYDNHKDLTNGRRKR